MPSDIMCGCGQSVTPDHVHPANDAFLAGMRHAVDILNGQASDFYRMHRFVVADSLYKAAKRIWIALQKIEEAYK